VAWYQLWLWWISNPEHLSSAAVKQSLRVVLSYRPISLRSVNLPDQFHSDPADRIITATAMTMELPLITKNEKIIAYPHIQTIWED
jgi:PIN domain nuclease of toxin-antitoxin system